MKNWKRIAAIIMIGTMLAVSANAENEYMVSFPYKLTGFESLQECSDIFTEIYGNGEYAESDDIYYYVIKQTNEKVYDMNIDIIACIENKNDNDETIDNILISLYDTSAIDSFSRLLSIFLFAQDNYGTRKASQTIKKQTDLNGNPVYYTFLEEIDQIEEAMFNNEKFEYSAMWSSDYEYYTIEFLMRINGSGYNSISVSLLWNKAIKELSD